MAKKYTPSGYQIINIDVVYDEDTEKDIVVDSDDKKLLLELLNGSTNGLKKPILLTINDRGNSYLFSGIPTFQNSELYFWTGDATIRITSIVTDLLYEVN